MNEIVDDLASRDDRLAAVIRAHPLCDLGVIPETSSNFESLVESVIAQQVSVKAADTIFSRLHDAAGGALTPERVAAMGDNVVRECGLSGSKTRTVLGLAEASRSGQIDFESLHLIDDDDTVSTQLNALWGTAVHAQYLERVRSATETAPADPRARLEANIRARFVEGRQLKG